MIVLKGDGYVMNVGGCWSQYNNIYILYFQIYIYICTLLYI